ncbi:hypothetical protein [Amycolatopsis sp. NPDC003676]
MLPWLVPGRLTPSWSVPRWRVLGWPALRWRALGWPVREPLNWTAPGLPMPRGPAPRTGSPD